MIKTGIANLPLHSGKAPKWLFGRMKKLGSFISGIIMDEYGCEEYLKRLSDPYFFQAFGCVLGFDWHSSGVTTTVCGALKEALNKENLGIKIAGGKGKTSRKAPDEILNFSDEFNLNENKRNKLIYSSKMSAKVDTSCVQDNYQLYHHVFVFTEKGKWAVIQQGMNSENRYARRYHWLSDNVKSFVNEPHKGICCEKKEKEVLDMTAKQSGETRKISLDIIKDNPEHLKKYFNKNIIKNKKIKNSIQRTIDGFNNKKIINFTMNPRHTIIDMNKKNIETLKKAYEIQPKNYEELVAIRGVGPKTVRSLALISELVYGAKASWKDPVKYSFAHGGKDNIPYPVNRKVYDKSIEILKNSINEARLGNKEKLYAIKRLSNFYQ